MSEIITKSVKELNKALSDGELSSSEITQAFVDKIKEDDDTYEVFLTKTLDEALNEAKAFDEKGQAPRTIVDGLPYVLKDNIVTKDIRTTAASKILDNFIPPYDASVYEDLNEDGAILLGKVNMDEFAMGSSTENSAYRKTKNPWDLTRVPGGSSGGSAAAVSAHLAPFALGSDTGGSIRQPAAYTGVVGVKPTYGLVSRYGLIAFASSLDQIGTFTNTVEDAALILSRIAKNDKKDSTSFSGTYPDFIKDLEAPLTGRTIAVVPAFEEGLQDEIRDSLKEAIDVYKDLGAEIVEVDFKLLEQALSAYYMIASAEASSNLARYDGVRYGVRAQDYDGLVDMYVKTRTEGFGPEVKRRIMLGTYALSSGYYDAFYKKAMQIRTLVVNEYDKIFKKADLLLTPTTATTAFKFGERSDPIEMYLSDLYTIPANISGIPALSMPAGLDKNGLPIGLQLSGPALSEGLLFNAAHAYEKVTGNEKLER